MWAVDVETIENNPYENRDGLIDPPDFPIEFTTVLPVCAKRSSEGA